MRVLVFLLFGAALHGSFAALSGIVLLPRENSLNARLSQPKTIAAQNGIPAFPKIEWPQYYEYTLERNVAFGLGQRPIGRLVLVPFDLGSAIFKKNYPFTTRVMTTLIESVKSSTNCDLHLSFPEFPDLNARRQFFGGVSTIKTPWGKGVLYLTQYNQEAHPPGLNRENVLWRFQGITNDERFYVSCFFVVENKRLPSMSEANSKLGQEVTGKSAQEYINTLPPSSFRPSVLQVSRFLMELEIQGNPGKE